MIKINDINKLSNLLSIILYYGFKNNYSYGVIERRIVKSSFIRCLENNDESFLYQYDELDILKMIYSNDLIDNFNIYETNAISLYLGEMYIKLFYRFHKSFEYIFLYMGLDKATKGFEVYHTMDDSEFYSYFNKECHKESILKMLLNKNQLSLVELSILTGIKIKTLENYSYLNEYIYNGKMEHIYKISNILDVNVSIFMRNIDNYIDTSSYDFDKYNVNYRLYYALNILSYFYKHIRNDNYVLSNSSLVGTHHSINVIFIKDDIDIKDEIKKYNDIIVIYDYRFRTDKLDLSYLKSDKTIYYINHQDLYEIGKNSVKKKEIPYLLKCSSIIKSKQIVGDFY